MDIVKRERYKRIKGKPGTGAVEDNSGEWDLPVGRHVWWWLYYTRHYAV